MENSHKSYNSCPYIDMRASASNNIDESDISVINNLQHFKISCSIKIFDYFLDKNREKK